MAAPPQLRAGQIFRLFCNFIDPPKPKFLVLAYVLEDGRARLFVINSEPTEYQKQSGELSKHQLPIGPAGYPKVLTHDSVLCCSELVGGWSAAELEGALVNPGHYVGDLRAEEIAAVRAAVDNSNVLVDRDKDLILAQLK